MFKLSVVAFLVFSVVIGAELWVRSQKVAPPPAPKLVLAQPKAAADFPFKPFPPRRTCIDLKPDPRPVLEICKNPTELQQEALEGLASQVLLTYDPEQCDLLYATLRKKINSSLYIRKSLDPLKTINQLEKLEVRVVNTCDFSILAEMISLVELNVSYSRFYDITPLTKLIHLQRLVLSGDSIDDLSALSGLTELTELQIDGNRFSDTTPLKPLKKLISLSLYGAKLSDIGPLTSLTGLQTLDLSRISIGLDNRSSSDPISNLLAPLEQMVSLKSLKLNKVADGKLKDLPNLQNLQQLERFEADENQISDLSPISQNKALKWLSLKKNRIVDLSPLAQLTGLEEVYLADNRIKSLEAARSWKELWILDIRRNQVKDVSPLAGLPKIMTLNAYGNPIKEIMSLSRSPNLWDITVDLPLIGALPTLRGLYLERIAADPNHRDHGFTTMQRVEESHRDPYGNPVH